MNSQTIGAGARTSFEPTTSSMVIPVLFSILEKKGVSVEEVCAKVGISDLRFDDPDLRIPLQQCLNLWQLAVEQTENPALGLDLFSHYGEQQMHFVSHMAMLCNNLRSALRHWSRFAPLVCETDRFEFRQWERQAGMFYINTSPAHHNRWMAEHYTVQCFHYLKKFTGKNIKLLEVRYAHSDPGYSARYEKLFKTSVLFNQAESGLVFHRKYLNSKIRSANVYMHRYMENRAQMLLDQLQIDASLVDRVQSQIVQLLPAGNATVDEVASRMFLDRRTLQRRLKEEQFTFRQLLEETRKTLALSYLDERMRLNEIARLLGFSDASAFQHAFRSWFGKSPGQFRAYAADKEQR
ncbi:MAG: AraC family transcriptional regulator [Leptospiraceae bacterium]|nr:AraC family transcriptional regulator [Leptospiraceae bacterium]